jgi:predicted nucleic acid-binding protein
MPSLPDIDFACPTIILDTNVVLDWLVFRDPGCASLGDAVDANAVRWCASVAMRAELAHVLGRGVAQAWSPDLAGLWSRWNRDCAELTAPDPSTLATRLRCSDPDDQLFIDFALAHRARWLLSHDRAVLKLARRARPFGLAIMTPTDWTATYVAAHPGPFDTPDGNP